MSHPDLSPVRSPKIPRTATVAALLALFLVAPAALAVDLIDNIADTVLFFQSNVDNRIAGIGEPATKAEKAELKCLQKLSAILGDTYEALTPLSAPDGLFETAALKGLSKVGGLMEKSGTTDPAVIAGFQALFLALDDWGEALDDIYDANRPSLTEKETAKVVKLAQKSGDAYDQSMDCFMNGELGKATKTGAKALIIFAKAVFLTQMYAND